MQKTRHPYIFQILLFLLCFSLSKWFYDSYLISYSYYISNYGVDFALSLNIIITLIISYFTYVFLNLCTNRQMKSSTLISCYFIYFFSLVYLLFLKNIGTQGFSLNPLSFIGEIENGSRFVPVMNLLMFVPLGFLYPLSRKNILLGFLGILMIESCQFVFHLGIFDLGDVSLNLLSLTIGNLFYHFFLQNWKQKHVIIVALHP